MKVFSFSIAIVLVFLMAIPAVAQNHVECDCGGCTIAQQEESGWVGFEALEVDKETLEFLDLDQGIQVTNIFRNSPAFTGGLREGDIITFINGEVATVELLNKKMSDLKVGDSITLTLTGEDVVLTAIKEPTLLERFKDEFDRGGEPDPRENGGDPFTREYWDGVIDDLMDDLLSNPDALMDPGQWLSDKVNDILGDIIERAKELLDGLQEGGDPFGDLLEQFQDFNERQEFEPRELPRNTRAWLGVQANNPTQEMLEEGLLGVVVENVMEDSPAFEAGVLIGDRIVTLDGIVIRNKTDLRDALETVELGRSVKLRVVRSSVTMELDFITRER